MTKNIQWRLALIALSVAVALFLFLPSTPAGKPAGLLAPERAEDIPGARPQGGSHLVMSRWTRSRRWILAGQHFGGPSDHGRGAETRGDLYQNGSGYLREGRGTAEDQVEKFVAGNYAIIEIKSRAKGELVYSMKAAEVRRLSEWAVTQALSAPDAGWTNTAWPNRPSTNRRTTRSRSSFRASRTPRRPFPSSRPRAGLSSSS